MSAAPSLKTAEARMAGLSAQIAMLVRAYEFAHAAHPLGPRALRQNIQLRNRAVAIAPLNCAQLAEVVAEVQPCLEVLAREGAPQLDRFEGTTDFRPLDVLMVLGLAAREHAGLCGALAIASGLPAAEVAELRTDEAMTLLAAVVDVNRLFLAASLSTAPVPPSLSGASWRN